MTYRVLSRLEMPITSEDDVAVVRRHVRELAQRRGFDAFATAAITTASSELSRNVVIHAGSGTAVLEAIEDDRIGIRLEFRDRGPGIPDLDRVLAGGYSTASSIGLGLSGSRRLVNEFHIESFVGQGTRVTVVKWRRAV